MRIVATLWRSTHPGPTLVVTALAIGLGVSSGLSAHRVVLLAASVLLGQMSIGLSNDAIDAPRDRAIGRRDKPLAQPEAPLRTAWGVAWTTAASAIILSALLSWSLALAHLLFLACGWAYNAYLKSTPASALCFVVGFGVFPSFVPLSLPDPHVAPLWASGAGAVFGIAIHFSNVLPDLADDERTGVRGLPHRLGARASALIAFGALVVGALFVALASGADGTAGSAASTVLSWTAFGGVVLLAVVGALLSTRESRRSFRLVMLAALLLGAQLVVTGGLAA